MSSFVKTNIRALNLKDIWEDDRLFTWKRANSDVMSTIDRILYSGMYKVVKKSVDWSLSMSDHAAIIVDFKMLNLPNKNRLKIPRLDGTLLNYDESKIRIFSNVNDLAEQMPNHWDPHMRLEYMKMCIRSVAEEEQARIKRRDKTREELLNIELNIAIKSLENDTLSVNSKASIIEHIEDLRAEKSVLIDEKGKRLAEKLGSKWYNEGEKSTRYFLRILNRPNKEGFTELKASNGELIIGEKEIEEGIVGFYKNLYENYNKTNLQENEHDETFFDNIIGMQPEEEDDIMRVVTNRELEATLNTCKDSAPGPDGIPYSYLRYLWPIIGDIITEAWNYSLQKKSLCPSHKLSYLKLIPKAGKDLSKLANWRPITLSNCDHKIVTKTYATRVSFEPRCTDKICYSTKCL